MEMTTHIAIGHESQEVTERLVCANFQFSIFNFQFA
jgi:hypothetical protein